MPGDLQRNVWADNGVGGALRTETHYDNRHMLCFSERPRTLAHMFDHLVGRFPQRPAIIEDSIITYRELDELVKKVSTGLSAMNVTRGDRVALFLGNCWEFLACVLACFRIGAIVVPIGTRQRHAELPAELPEEPDPGSGGLPEDHPGLLGLAPSGQLTGLS